VGAEVRVALGALIRGASTGASFGGRGMEPAGVRGSAGIEERLPLMEGRAVGVGD